MDAALLLQNVTKRFSGHTAVDDLSLVVPRGSIYGILGPNGAGKSTTLRMIMNIIMPDSGTISILGSDPGVDRRVLRRIGYLPEERGLHKKMKVIDVILFFAELKGVDRRTALTEGMQWLERMDLAKWSASKVETLSKGMQQKVQFITTVLHHPDVLILDEPHSGLDPVNQEVLRDTIYQAQKEGRTVLLSTHNMSQAQAMCEYVCIIARGRKVLDGRVDTIRRENRGDRFELAFDSSSKQADLFMESSAFFRRRARNGPDWEVELQPGTDVRRLLAGLAELDVPVARFEHVEPSLHEIFVERVSDADTASAAPPSFSAM
jgi:ABC-2 type transport system ATP-binding protein